MRIIRSQNVINNLEVTIIQRFPEQQAKGDYEQIETQITYMNEGVNVEITIPTVAKGQNRKRKLSVKIDGKKFPFNQASLDVLDMSKTFDLPEMSKLLRRIGNTITPSPADETLRATLPFFYIYSANYQLPEEKRKHHVLSNGKLLLTNGNIIKLITPYIREIKNHPGKKREIYIPVVTLGDPHHWNLCILTIDEQDKPSLTYLESVSGVPSTYIEMYTKYIIPCINKVLVTQGFIPINESDLSLCTSRQFSERGCGIAASLNLQKLLNGTVNLAQLNDSSRLTIEEDAIERVQLALEITKHDKYISQYQQFDNTNQLLSKKAQYQLEEVLRELVTHPNSLKVRAEEAFPVQTASKSFKTKLSLLEQIKQKIEAKEKWHFDGLIGYSHYKSDNKMIPKGIKQILDLIDDTTLTSNEKLMAIKNIAEEKKGLRFASAFPGLGLFMRSHDTKQFYAEIAKLCTSELQKFAQNSRTSPNNN